MKKLLCLVLGIIGLFVMPAMADNPCRNLFDTNTLETGYFINGSGTQQSITNVWSISGYIPVSAGEYTLSFINNFKDYYKRVVFYTSNTSSSDGEVLAAFDGRNVSGRQFITVSVTGTGYIRFGIGTADTEIQFEQGDTATSYVPYCDPIKIATTKYVETQFSDLDTALANAVSVVNTVVSNTISQASSIGTLQSTKQTRPDETCPAGKKCLLVEDTSGVPHWYEIVE